MATVSEALVSSSSRAVRNLSQRRRDQTAGVRRESLNVSLRSSCLRFSSCLAQVVTLNHPGLFQLLSALPQKEKLQRPLSDLFIPS